MNVFTAGKAPEIRRLDRVLTRYRTFAAPGHIAGAARWY